jgi:hypothetical protein
VTDDEPIALRSTWVEREDPPPPDPDGFDFDTFEASIVPIGVPHDPYYVIKNSDGTKTLVPYTPAIRDISDITGICLHQTACVMGENPPRYRRLSIHYVVTLDGVPIQTCPIESRLFGGDRWNNGTIQIEVDGAYPGLLDDPTTLDKREDAETFWAKGPVKTPMRTTAVAMRTLRNLQRYLIELVRRKGGAIRVIVAHRQASGTRQSDPGAEIWQQGALPILEEHGLSDGGVGFKLGDGRPIPEGWDPRCKGIPY